MVDYPGVDKQCSILQYVNTYVYAYIAIPKKFIVYLCMFIIFAICILVCTSLLWYFCWMLLQLNAPKVQKMTMLLERMQSTYYTAFRSLYDDVLAGMYVCVY